MLVLLTRILLWASVGLLVWYAIARVIPKKYLTWFGGVILVLLLLLSFLIPDDDTVQVIWRIVSFPLTPLGASLVLIGSALTDGTKKAKGTPVAIALSILLFSSIPVVAQLLVNDAEQSVRRAYLERVRVCGEVCPADIPLQGDLGEAAAIVVLGDRSDLGTLEESQSTVEASINAALTPRLNYAASLYQQSGVRPFVVVTADSNNSDDEVSSEETVIRNVLTRGGVLSEDIITTNDGLDARDAAEAVEELLEEQGLISDSEEVRRNATDDRRVVLIAPAIVMSRAALTFEQLALEVIARPTDFYVGAAGLEEGDLLDRLPAILPSVDALQLTTRYWDEVLTSLYYFLRGWLPDFNFGWDPNIEL